jgi:nitrogenase-associated protein
MRQKIMPELVFYEKPGCVGNRMQKALLRERGIELDVRDILTTPWTVASLRPFFGDRPIVEWFNDTAPSIKDGVVLPHLLDEHAALDLMIDDPILIRRPLLEYEGLQQSGFTQGAVVDVLNIQLASEVELQTCPMQTQSCEGPM